MASPAGAGDSPTVVEIPIEGREEWLAAASIARARVLIAAALAATKLLETGELTNRLAALEAAAGLGRGQPPEIAFPDEPA